MPDIRRVVRGPSPRWLCTTTLVVFTLLALVACTAAPSAPSPQVIAEKGTPYGDLLVPELQASVTDGAIGVSVDTPVTVSAGDGVLGTVRLVNEAGLSVAGQVVFCA